MAVTPDPTIDVADEAQDDALNQDAAPNQAADATLGDSRFFAQPSSVASGGTTDPNYAGQSGQNSSARRLRMSLFYAAQQDPNQYAGQLQLQKLTGIPPIVSAGNEKQIQQVVDAKKINPRFFTTMAPVIAAWASTPPDNAAVAGVDGLQCLGKIEQNGAGMRAVYASAKNPLPNFPVPASNASTAPGFLSRLWDWSTQPLNLGYLRENIAAADAQVNAGPTLADVEDAEEHPVIHAIRDAVNTGVTAFGSNAAKMFLTPLGVASALAGPAGEVAGQTIPAVASAIRLLETGVGAGFGAKGIYDQVHQGLGKQPNESTLDYIARTAGNAALVTGGVTAGAHAVSGAIDGLGYEQVANEGLGEGAREAVGESPATVPAVVSPATVPVAGSPYFGNLSEAISSVAESELRDRAPEVFNDGLQNVFGGDTIRVSRPAFDDHFLSKSMNPEAVKAELGATNSADVAAADGYVEVPTARYLGKLATEDQQGLLPNVLDPTSGLTLSQHQADIKAVQQWVADGGMEKLQAELEQTDPETTATPEWQAMQEDLRQRYIDAGQTPEAADTLATKDANVYSNLARYARMKPSEQLNLFDPTDTTGEAPESSGESVVSGGDPNGGEEAAGEEQSPLYDGKFQDSDFDQADVLTEEHNAANSPVRLIPREGWKEPAVALSPGAYAYLRKRAPYLGDVDWHGVFLRPSTTGRLLDLLERPSGGLPENAKASVAALAKAIRENRTLAGGVIFVRDGLHPTYEAMALAEERVHAFQHSFPVDESWLRKHSAVVKQAEQELDRLGYNEGDFPDEISAKILAGDRLGLSLHDAEKLRDAYLSAIQKHYPYTGLKSLRELVGSERRLDGPQFNIRETPSRTGGEDLLRSAGSEGADTAGRRRGEGSHREETPGASGAEQSRREGQEGVTSSSSSEGSRRFNLSSQTNKRPTQFYADALTKKIAADPAAAVREYNGLKGTDGGRVLNTDYARELSEHYRDDKTRASDVHQPASQFVADLYTQKLKAFATTGHEPLVLFTAGGAGAGKSSSLETPEGRLLKAKADIIYDTTMSDPEWAEWQIQQALDAGGKAAIMYTYRDPVEALTGGILPRAMKNGRTIPLDVHAGSHVGARSTIEKLRQKYAGDSRVEFIAVDNTRGQGNARVVNFDALPLVEEDGLRERLQDALEAEFKAKRISEAVRERTADSRRDVQSATSTSATESKTGGRR